VARVAPERRCISASTATYFKAERQEIDMQEIWKPVPGYETRYEVSNYGRIRSFVIGGSRDGSERILRGGNLRGYRMLILCKDGEHKSALIHRLVAMAFLGMPPTEKHQVNHLNYDKADNRVENLEWITHADNNRYSAAVIPRNRGEANHSKLTEEQVKQIRERHTPGKKDGPGSLGTLAKEFGISSGTCWNIIKRKKWSHI
jgi:hypothetical protein